ncbi:MAG: YCF48-related protein [Bacteroidota bacterium]
MKKISILLISVLIINKVQTQPWVQQTSGVTSSLNSIYFTDANTGYTCGDGGIILKTTNGGTNWNSLTSGTIAQLNSVFFTSSTTGYVVGGSGAIRKTTNSGTNWNAQTSTTSNYLYGVYFTDSNNGYTVGWSGTILKTTNGGSTWVLKTSGTTAPLYSVFFTGTSTGYAVGGTSGSLILKTIDGGTNWTPQTCSATNSLRSVFFTGVDTGYVAGYDGKIFKTTDGGANWISQTSGVTINIQSIYFPDENTGYAVCNAGYVIKTTNGGSNWTASATIATDVLMSAFFTGVNNGYVSGGNGTIMKTTTGGEPCTITANAGTDQAICSGQSATLTASGGSTYSWSTGANTASIIVSPSSTTTYTVTATSSNDCTASDNVIVNLSAGGPAGISIAANPTGSICSGTSVTYTATPTNGGTPAYQWQLNGTNISGETNSTYTTTTLASGDNIACVMTSSLSCVTGSPATSNSITKTVYPSIPVSISIAANPSGGICTGTSVTFTATPTNGGASPAFQWKKNGTNITGATTTTYTSSTLANGDIITCTLTSTVTCPSGNPATSNSITMTVSSSLPANVSIAASPGVIICSGTSVTFTATPTNGGTPSYQWKINGSNISGATNSTYTSSILSNNDNITCVMTSSLTCATGSPATSNILTVTVNPSIPASVNIAAIPGITICSGTSVTFTATPANGGASPAFQWKNNGTNISGATNSTYTSSTLANGNAITCIMTSNATCVTGSPATSNTLTMTVNPILPVSVSIAASPGGPICSGNSVTFTATPTNGGSSPTYQWQNNGTNISGATNSTYTSSSLADADAITCIMTSALSCVTGSPASSNTYNLTVYITIADAGTNQIICAGQPATLTSFGGGTYLWSTGSNNQSISVSPASTTIYTVTVTNNGCSATDDVVVTVNALPNANAGNNVTICLGDSTTLNATGGITFVWNPSATLTDANIANPVASPTSTTTYTVTVTDTNGCLNSDNVTVTVSFLSANPISDVDICLGSSTILSASGGTTYEWSPGTGLSSTTVSNPTASPVTTTNYVVTITNADGCTATDDVTVTVNLLPTANAGTDTTICDGSFTNLSASGGSTYSWSPGTGLSATNISNPVASPSVTTVYIVTVTDANGCTDSDDVLITVNPIPPTPVISLAGNILTSDADSSNQWYLNDTLIAGATDTNYTATESGNYYVIVTINGCSSDTSNIISMTVGIDEVYFNNDFTIHPNPATCEIEISLAEKSEIEILNIKGQLIKTINTEEDFIRIDISGFARGMYFVKVKTEEGVEVKKFIKE